MPNQEVDFRYIVEKDYKIHAANGAFGGLTTRGEFKLDFFIEGSPIPNAVSHGLDEKGRLLSETKRDQPQSFDRRIQVGVLLSREHAEGIALWILEQIKAYNDARENLETQ